MTFKITIEKSEPVRKIAGREWKQVGTKPDGSAEYGYTPEIEKVEIETVTIYTQRVDNLDLAGVIRAVNQDKPLFLCDKHGLHREVTCPLCFPEALK